MPINVGFKTGLANGLILDLNRFLGQPATAHMKNSIQSLLIDYFVQAEPGSSEALELEYISTHLKASLEIGRIPRFTVAEPDPPKINITRKTALWRISTK